MTENEKDIQLLQLDPDALILKYQGSVRSAVERYVWLGMFSRAEAEDTIQNVNEELLRRVPTILRNYDQRSLFVTYFLAVIRNICLTLHKESKMQYQPLGGADLEDSSANQVFDRLAIGEALAGLREVIELYHHDKPRLIILLRIYFRLPLDEKTVLSAYPDCPIEEISKVLESLGEDVALKEERELLELVAPFLNSMEGKSTSSGGYRHWIGEKVREILPLLRVRLGVPGFDLDALGLLFETLTLRSEDKK